MGAKGPVFVVILGAGAMIAFGMMAKLLVQEVPTAHAVVKYRQLLGERYDLERVEIRAQGGDYRVRLHNGTLAVAPDAKTLRSLAGEFRREYQPSRSLESVEFIGMSSGGGCSGSMQRWRAKFDFGAESRAAAAEFSKLTGTPCSLRILSATAVRLEVRKLLSPEKRKLIGVELSTLWGGGWQYIQIRTGGRVYNFDSEGKSLR